MRDEGDRFVAWRLDDASARLTADPEDERMERALLAYAHRSAARVGAEWFAAEFARRDEEERLQQDRAGEGPETLAVAVRPPAPEVTLVDASVEGDVVGGPPLGLGLEPSVVELERAPAADRLDREPMPAPALPKPAQPVVVPEVDPTPQPPVVRHPHVPRPPAPEPAPEPKRRRRHRKQSVAATPSIVISAPEWARMSPGARRLYGLDASPPAA